MRFIVDLLIIYIIKLISFILDGCMYSFGIVMQDIKVHFNVSQEILNLVQSFNFGFSMLSGTYINIFKQPEIALLN